MRRPKASSLRWARDFVPLILLSRQRRGLHDAWFQTAWQRTITAALKASELNHRFTMNDLRANAGSESREWKRFS
ncbi:MAG: hypothetical protein M3374_01100 [Pseudomonadota bacterium]|nr:hypothetical protein [Pseudomonadota bacterium]